MRSFKRLLVLIVAIGLAAVVVLFTLENRTPIQLLLFGWQTAELPMALYVLGAFVLGLVLGPVLSWWPHQRLRMRYNKQVKQLRASEEKIQALQSTAVEQKAELNSAPELPKAS